MAFHAELRLTGPIAMAGNQRRSPTGGAVVRCGMASGALGRCAGAAEQLAV
jgi:hypothetical protein